MTSAALNNLWNYIDGLSLSKRDRKWLAEKLIEPNSVDAETLRQQQYVKETLCRALDEVKTAKKEGRQLMTDEEFLKELEKEGLL